MTTPSDPATMDSMRSAARLARALPAAPMTLIANAVGVSYAQVAEHLRSLAPRGRCAAAALPWDRDALQHQACPPPVLRAAAALPWDRDALQHQACPPPVLRAAADSSKRPHLSGGYLRHAASATGTGAWSVRRGDDPAAPASTQRAAGARIAASLSPASPDLRFGGGLPAALMWALTAVEDPQACALDAADTRCPRDLLEMLTRHHLHAAAAAAANPACPAALMPRLAGADIAAGRLDDPDGKTTERLHRHRLAAAANPNCPSGLLELLGTHHAPSVRAAVAANPACPEGLRDLLGSDSRIMVSEAARTASARIPKSVLEHLSPDPRNRLRIPLKESRFETSYEESHWTIMALAANPFCPRESFAHLVRQWGVDTDSGRAVAANPSAPALYHITFTPGGTPYQKLLTEAGDPGTAPRRVARLTGHHDVSVAAAAANNPACPNNTLRLLACHRWWQVRAGAAANPNTAPQTMQDALTDSHPGVRHCAAASCRGLVA